MFFMREEPLFCQRRSSSMLLKSLITVAAQSAVSKLSKNEQLIQVDFIERGKMNKKVTSLF